LFGTGGGERLAKAVELPLLGQVPLYPRVMEGGDTGAPIVTSDAQSSAARALEKIATQVAAAAMALTPA
jgi:ATP-binding protein involved in chromosome partitioning